MTISTIHTSVVFLAIDIIKSELFLEAGSNDYILEASRALNNLEYRFTQYLDEKNKDPFEELE